MNIRIALALLGVAALSACGGDFSTPLPHGDNEKVGVWVSPRGCQSWYFYDGTGAFMSPRMQPNGQPVCNTPALPPKADAATAPAGGYN